MFHTIFILLIISCLIVIELLKIITFDILENRYVQGIKLGVCTFYTQHQASEIVLLLKSYNHK